MLPGEISKGTKGRRTRRIISLTLDNAWSSSQVQNKFHISSQLSYSYNIFADRRDGSGRQVFGVADLVYRFRHRAQVVSVFGAVYVDSILLPRHWVAFAWWMMHFPESRPLLKAMNLAVSWLTSLRCCNFANLTRQFQNMT